MDKKFTSLCPLFVRKYQDDINIVYVYGIPSPLFQIAFSQKRILCKQWSILYYQLLIVFLSFYQCQIMISKHYSKKTSDAEN